jgi:hypothetical protein
VGVLIDDGFLATFDGVGSLNPSSISTPTGSLVGRRAGVAEQRFLISIS